MGDEKTEKKKKHLLKWAEVIRTYCEINAIPHTYVVESSFPEAGFSVRFYSAVNTGEIVTFKIADSDLFYEEGEKEEKMQEVLRSVFIHNKILFEEYKQVTVDSYAVKTELIFDDSRRIIKLMSDGKSIVSYLKLNTGLTFIEVERAWYNKIFGFRSRSKIKMAAASAAYMLMLGSCASLFIGGDTEEEIAAEESNQAVHEENIEESQKDEDSSTNEEPDNEEVNDTENSSEEKAEQAVNEEEEMNTVADEEENEIAANEEDIFNPEITADFTTDIDEPESDISEENYKKYNDVMDYLAAYPDKSEEVLFGELAGEYGESVDELREFMSSHMDAAIAYDVGRSTNEVSIEESDVKSTIKAFFYENVQEPSLLDINENQADVQITNLRTLSEGEFEYAGEKFDYILKTEYTGDFQQVSVFQLKVNGVNIDLD
ncbi:hypothetical protein [Alkalicoccus halolimnae]|uniref:Uncharacterized protein n=1 Tax=Alkalicoccus halolimnae TaxID=1667239 RepID=A0A5C7FII4_9BACI|nr:hypothetical protein [Alkalicoccus halolimnae]TXF85296.1 hypothetical protein FTX54_08895 [Alkalicoccus halolimnae]